MDFFIMRHQRTMKAPYYCLLAFLLICTITCARADEQNGLSVSITRKTVDRNLSRGPRAETTKIVQGLKAEVKNVRLKPLPTGEVRWTILVRRHSDEMMRYQGSEPLKALKNSETTEVMFGDFNSVGIRGYEGIAKDKLEYQLVILHEGKETYRFATVPNFAALAKESTPGKRQRGEEDEAPPKLAEVDPKKMPMEPKKVAEPEKKATPPTPETKKVVPPVEPAPPVRPPVDFFNLGGK